MNEKKYINGIEVIPPKFICQNCGCIELEIKFLESNKAIQMRCSACGKFFGNYKYAKAETYIMPFGKHKGEKLTELPNDYLEWLYYKSDISGNLYDAVEEILERRRGA